MNQLTPKEVHDNDEKLAGRKAKPGTQMRFEANHGRAIHRGDVHLREKRLQPAAQPVGRIIGEMICLGDHRVFSNN
jgi:hypothetical protein